MTLHGKGSERSHNFLLLFIKLLLFNAKVRRPNSSHEAATSTNDPKCIPTDIYSLKYACTNYQKHTFNSRVATNVIFIWDVTPSVKKIAR